MKHVGKMKNNGARIAIVFRTIPGDPLSALVIGTTGLGDAFHDALMSVIESDSGQQANELADILAVRRFPDGSNMLEWMHGRGYLKKVPTNLVWVTPDNKTQIQLDELNNLIADQKGVTVDELSIKEESASAKASKEENIASKNKWDKLREEKAAKKLADSQPVVTDEPEVTLGLTPAEMRSRADALYKEAARLRKEADAVDPPKKKSKTETVEE